MRTGEPDRKLTPRGTGKGQSESSPMNTAHEYSLFSASQWHEIEACHQRVDCYAHMGKSQGDD